MGDGNLIKAGRLALRVEGNKWVAYYAKTGTMDGALWLGAIHMSAVQGEARKQDFITLMRNVVSDLLEDRVGVRPQWPDPPQKAPEHERAGSA